MNRIVITFLAALLCLAPLAVSAADPVRKSVAELYQEKDQLKGKQVKLHGKVVKVNNGIMNRNFIHLRDGTGEKGTNDITITSQDTAKVGDEITAVGTVTVDLDFGAGYTYPVIVEKATITKDK